jgi:hypothetical protein
MARSRSGKRHETGRTITTKTMFGSHADMVVDHTSFDLTLKENEVLCQDGDRYYVTTRDRLDNGMADSRRYSGKGVEVDG